MCISLASTTRIYKDQCVVISWCIEQKRNVWTGSSWGCFIVLMTHCGDSYVTNAHSSPTAHMHNCLMRACFNCTIIFPTLVLLHRKCAASWQGAETKLSGWWLSFYGQWTTNNGLGYLSFFEFWCCFFFFFFLVERCYQLATDKVNPRWYVWGTGVSPAVVNRNSHPEEILDVRVPLANVHSVGLNTLFGIT
jgi:hypothetical protein